MMNKQSKDISICIFGSAARATNDAMSDRDVLIVACDRRRAKSVISSWEMAGWSVSFYSRTRLQKVAQAGSLFVKHLQLEGRMVADPSGWLTEALAQYRVKPSYSAEISDAQDLALPLQRLKGNAFVRDRSLAADIGYVFLRNYAIYRCAEERTYLFDYASLLEELQPLEGFSDKCRDHLMSLRLGKHIYRSGYAAVRDMSKMGCAGHWIAEACPNLGIEPIAPDTPIRSLATPYSTLRDCEAALCVHGLLDTNHGCVPQSLKKIWRTIKSPKDYSWHVAKIDSTWVEMVNAAISDFAFAQHSRESLRPLRQRFRSGHPTF